MTASPFNMKKIVTVKKKGSNLPIELDVNRIVAITNKTIPDKEGDEVYYIYFEFAVWAVQGESYETVRETWLEK